jgi:hypothetical protein
MADIQDSENKEAPSPPVIATIVQVVEKNGFARHLFEWAMAGALILTALIIFAYPESVDASSFYKVLNLVGDPHILASIYLVIGAARFGAQYIGNERWGPHARAATSLVCSMIWLHMVAAFVMIIPERGVPSPSIGLYLSLTMAEWYATYRAAASA